MTKITRSEDQNRIPLDEAKKIGEQLGMDFDTDYSLEEFRMGLEVELEHGTQDNATNVTNDDPLQTGKIAFAHLQENPRYYTRLKIVEGNVGVRSKKPFV